MSRLIDADAVIDALTKLRIEKMQEGKDVSLVWECLDKVMQAPTAQPEQRWIPCSERLPEDIKPVLITWKNTDPASYYQYIVGKHFIGSGHFCNGKWFWYSSTCEDYLAEYGRCDVDEIDEAIEVLAWMPLPDPWEGENNGI